MKIVNKLKDMQAFSNSIKKEGKIISFVPTMGALHEGHLSLMRAAKKKGNFLVVSIFVNPTQFGPNEDFNKYTRDLDGDIKKISDIGVDAVFFPDVDEIYPEGFETYVEVGELQKPLCGKFRPGHFKGVATVVLKLFNIVKPDIALFGEKDYQQLLIIKKMVRDLHLEIEIVGMPIIREKDGLALSSRNAYLSDEDRARALALSESLREIEKKYKEGNKNISDLVQLGIGILKKSSINDIDYFEIRNGSSLGSEKEAQPGDIVAIAARIGNTRLIDNT
ncbi:MAG: pantoate--beta-alanine ligase, partial [Thermodesulfobacteriota bacterium]